VNFEARAASALRALHAGLTLAGFLVLTFAALPFQWVLVALGSPAARRLPHWYHRRVCGLFGVRVHTAGRVVADRPVLIVSNHISWLDIMVLSSVAPLSFIAKSEVGTWPFVALLARLQRTIFIERGRRTSVRETSGEIIARLAGGDNVVLFAEGTSSDGNRVLAFQSSLFAAARPGRREDPAAHPEAARITVQTLALAYTRRDGLPIGRVGRPAIAWYGDMELAGHAWELLKGARLDAHIIIGEPVPLDRFKDRKELARHTEGEVRANFTTLLRCGGFATSASMLPESTAPRREDAANSNEVLDVGRRRE